MLLSDNETKIDLLNNAAIAKTIVNLIHESGDKPISIGIHGDWGAGKSSILEMVENQFETGKNEKKVICIRFNGWKHQGFSDTKMSLMSAIVSELVRKEDLLHKASDTVQKLWKNINWLSAAKVAGNVAFSLATGTAPFAILNSAIDSLKNLGSSDENVTKTIENIESYLKDSKVFEDTSTAREFIDFQRNFDELIEKTGTTKLVVLIDDLDRCLPEVTIEILEAIRLFMFNTKTAFVIAADESMIRYAVKKHFPDVIDEEKHNKANDYSNSYLEKIIQVPFKIPTLGAVEATNYIMLLMVSSKIPVESTEFKPLLENAISKLKKPWDLATYNISDVKSLLKENYDKVVDEVMIAAQISPILSRHTSGNPRKIKRFINMLLLRYQISQARGFGEAIKLGVLAKMMLIEYYWQDFYKVIAINLDSEGKCAKLSVTESSEDNSGTNPNEGKTDKTLDEWLADTEIKELLKSEPFIDCEDLRPYYFASKENIDYIFSNHIDQSILEVLSILMGSDMEIAQANDRIQNLAAPDVVKIYELMIDKISVSGKITNDDLPDGIVGLRKLVQHHPELRPKLLTFITGLDKKKVGCWVVNGWAESIPESSPERKDLEAYITDLSKSGSPSVKRLAKAVLKR